MASPMGSSDVTSVSHKLISPRDHDNIDYRQSWCSGAGSGIKDWDKAQEVYFRVKLPTAVDAVIRFFSPNGEDGWLRANELNLFGDEFGGDSFDNEGSSGCTDLSTPCMPGRNEWGCFKYFDHEPDKIEWKYAYWAFRAMRGVHKKLAMMQSEIRDSTILNSLDIKTMLADFEADDNSEAGLGSEMMAWMSTAMLTISTIAGLSAPVIGAAGAVLGLALGRTSAELAAQDGEDTAVTLGELETWLGGYFDASRRSMQTAVSLAAGVQQDGARFDTLPSLAYKTTEKDFGTESHIARFFSTPFWLLDVDSQIVRDAVNAGGSNIRYKLIDTILQTVGWAVMGDDEIKDQATCDDTRGGRWMEVDGTSYCLSLWWLNERDQYQQSNLDSPLFANLEKHKMVELETYYRGALKCAKAGRSGTRKIEVDDVVANELPECFFSPEVKWRVRVQPSKEACSGLGLNALCIPTNKVTDWYESG